VGKYKKSQVRKLAKEFGLPTAERRDSRGICFVADSNEEFLRRYLKVKPGKIVDIDGNEIGEHQGLLYYTVGQRHGVDRSKIKNQRSKIVKKEEDMPPLYVVGIDIENNQLVVGREEDLYSKSLIAKDVSWIAGKEPSKNQIGARIRYRHPINSCQIKKISERQYQVEFEKSQRAITPGQSVVFYLKDQVLGGGIILDQKSKIKN
jgi:tRNA-specific 2-thiouridylase